MTLAVGLMDFTAIFTSSNTFEETRCIFQLGAGLRVGFILRFGLGFGFISIYSCEKGSDQEYGYNLVRAMLTALCLRPYAYGPMLTALCLRPYAYGHTWVEFDLG